MEDLSALQGNYSNLKTYFCFTGDLLEDLESHVGR